PSTAVVEARTLQPSAILLDVLMPEHDGRDILRELKADAATNKIPVIVISVVEAADVPDLADAHANKPVRMAPLLRAPEEHAAEGADERLRLIACTADAMVGDRERALAGGYDGYMSKRIECATFTKTVERFLA